MLSRWRARRKMRWAVRVHRRHVWRAKMQPIVEAARLHLRCPSPWKHLKELQQWYGHDPYDSSTLTTRPHQR